MSECNKCNGTLFVCENHPDQEAHQCKHCGGAGMPCECTKISEPIAYCEDLDLFGMNVASQLLGLNSTDKEFLETPLYTHPQKELSRKEFLEIWENEVNKFHDVEEYDIANFARAIIKTSRGEK